MSHRSSYKALRGHFQPPMTTYHTVWKFTVYKFRVHAEDVRRKLVVWFNNACDAAMFGRVGPNLYGFARFKFAVSLTALRDVSKDMNIVWKVSTEKSDSTNREYCCAVCKKIIYQAVGDVTYLREQQQQSAAPPHTRAGDHGHNPNLDQVGAQIARIRQEISARPTYTSSSNHLRHSPHHYYRKESANKSVQAGENKETVLHEVMNLANALWSDPGYPMTESEEMLFLEYAVNINQLNMLRKYRQVRDGCGGSSKQVASHRSENGPVLPWIVDPCSALRSIRENYYKDNDTDSDFCLQKSGTGLSDYSDSPPNECSELVSEEVVGGCDDNGVETGEIVETV